MMDSSSVKSLKQKRARFPSSQLQSTLRIHGKPIFPPAPPANLLTTTGEASTKLHTTSDPLARLWLLLLLSVLLTAWYFTAENREESVATR